MFKEVEKARKKFGEAFDEAKFRETNPNVLRNRTKIDEVRKRMADALNANDLAALRQIMDSYRQQGMRTLDFSLRELLATGKITASEAYARATDKRQFQHFLVGY